MLRAARSETGALDGHVFNLGHGISQHTPLENVGVLVEAVHELIEGPETLASRESVTDCHASAFLR